MDFVLISGAVSNRYVKEETPAEENVELSLGLSLNGRFGADKNYGNNNGLIRASSVAEFLSFPAIADDRTPFSVYEPLTRTCSLPAEAEEWKKRKELQSVKRSAAKRKRVEKMNNLTVVKSPAMATTMEEKCEVKRKNLMNGNELWGSPPPSVLPPLPRPVKFPSPASVGSPGSGGSSGVSDLESPPFSGLKKEPDLKSTATQQSTSYQKVMRYWAHELNEVNVTSKHVLDKFSTTLNNAESKYETLRMMLADMPCVSTKGENNDGKKVEGFLYRYRKGEDVRIVCICHGNFLSPAEFVKHGGGVDVEHPLRHIVVNPPSL